MTDAQVGRILRALRRRLGLTHRQLGARAGVSQQAVSLIERGHASKLSGETLRRVFAAVDARWEPAVSWRGGGLDRLLDEGHARLVAACVQWLRGHGWIVVVEATYSQFGERGSIVVLAAHPDARAVLVIEVKSELTAIEATVRKIDEKARLVREVIGRDRFGFRPALVGRLLALPATDTARRRVRGSSTVLDVAFPSRGASVRTWGRRPTSDLSGIHFFADTNRGSVTGGRGGSQRVRSPRPRSG